MTRVLPQARRVDGSVVILLVIKKQKKKFAMLKNYVKVAWRNLMKSKTFSFINIFGLSVGLTCCMLISLYILNELNYDKYHKNADSIHQLATVFIMQGKEDKKPTRLTKDYGGLTNSLLPHALIQYNQSCDEIPIA